MRKVLIIVAADIVAPAAFGRDPASSSLSIPTQAAARPVPKSKIGLERNLCP
jgi:hypothetical protein